jgi:hypothetical protein
MQVRSMCFTKFGFIDLHQGFEELKVKLNVDNIKYFVCGFEICPETGREHLQCYVQFHKKVTIAKIAKELGCHCEPTKGTPKQASDYCMEDGHYLTHGVLADPSTGGQETSQRYTAILDLARSGQLEEIRENYPGHYLRHYRTLGLVHMEAYQPTGSLNRKCYWISGKPRLGKSRFINDNYQNIYWKNPNKWWDNYNGQKVVVIDDFSKSHNVLGYYLKRWADRYPVLAEIKGNACYPTYEVLFITSNYRISEIFTEDLVEQEAIAARFEQFDFQSYDPVTGRIVAMRPGDDHQYIYNINDFSPEYTKKAIYEREKERERELDEREERHERIRELIGKRKREGEQEE